MALHPTPEAGAFFAFAISEQNVAFAKSSLASGAGDLGLGNQSITHEHSKISLNTGHMAKQKTSKNAIQKKKDAPGISLEKVVCRIQQMMDTNSEWGPGMQEWEWGQVYV